MPHSQKKIWSQVFKTSDQCKDAKNHRFIFSVSRLKIKWFSFVLPIPDLQLAVSAITPLKNDVSTLSSTVSGHETTLGQVQIQLSGI